MDPVTKQAGLSLLPHLQLLTLPSPTPMLGQLFDGTAKIMRVFNGLGLLLELPMGEQAGGGKEATCAGERGSRREGGRRPHAQVREDRAGIHRHRWDKEGRRLRGPHCI